MLAETTCNYSIVIIFNKSTISKGRTGLMQVAGFIIFYLWGVIYVNIIFTNFAGITAVIIIKMGTQQLNKTNKISNIFFLSYYEGATLLPLASFFTSSNSVTNSVTMLSRFSRLPPSMKSCKTFMSPEFSSSIMLSLPLSSF